MFEIYLKKNEKITRFFQSFLARQSLFMFFGGLTSSGTFIEKIPQIYGVVANVRCPRQNCWDSMDTAGSGVVSYSVVLSAARGGRAKEVMKQKNKPRLIMNEFFKYYYMSTFIGNKCTCVYAENICGQLIFFFPLLFLFGDILQTS